MKLLRNLVAIILLIILVYFISTKSSYISNFLHRTPIGNYFTDRSQILQKQLLGDFAKQFATTQKQVMNLKVSDMNSYLAQAQKAVLGIKTSLEQQASQSAKNTPIPHNSVK